MEVVAHQIQDSAKKLVRGVALDEVVTRRMDSDLGGRQGEYEPSPTGIDTLKTEDVAEELAIGRGIFAVEEEVSPVDHRSVWECRLGWHFPSATHVLSRILRPDGPFARWANGQVSAAAR